MFVRFWMEEEDVVAGTLREKTEIKARKCDTVGMNTVRMWRVVESCARWGIKRGCCSEVAKVGSSASVFGLVSATFGASGDTDGGAATRLEGGSVPMSRTVCGEIVGCFATVGPCGLPAVRCR